MLKAKKKCRTRCARRVPFSETVNKEGAGVCFYKLAIKSKGGAATRASTRQKNTSSGKINRVQKKVGLQHVKWNMLGINTLRSLLKDQMRTHNNVKKMVGNTMNHTQGRQQKTQLKRKGKTRMPLRSNFYTGTRAKKIGEE